MKLVAKETSPSYSNPKQGASKEVQGAALPFCKGKILN